MVLGDVDKFTGFVPKDKLHLIDKFKIKDYDDGIKIVNIQSYWSSNRTNISDIFIKGLIRKSGTYYHIYKKRNSDEYAFQSGDGINFYASDSKNIFGLAYLGNIRFTTSKGGLQICAPLSEMDMSDKTIKDGYKVVKNPPKDPIVLHPVDGGYLIVCAWGDEASDKLITNVEKDPKIEIKF